MNWLNYHHLKYFWMVVREGSISKASKVLNLTQPTISKQLSQLEEQIGESLFERVSNRMVLTEAGQMAFEYAEEIFSLGQEFLENIRGVSQTKPSQLRVGVSFVMPKLISHKILSPILQTEDKVHLFCEEDHTERLLAELSIQRLDLVLSDAPVSGSVRVKAFNHFLGDCGISFFAEKKLSQSLKGEFPKCLDGAPFVALSHNSLSRRSLDIWLDTNKIRPNIIAEFEDSALMKVFGRNGAGIFSGPSVIKEEICKDNDVVEIGSTEEVKDNFYAITIERKVKHPAVVKLAETARKQVFGSI